uniref:G_PROTEIN_RECEP_F3_4 domain-containing protein n=1 Tax=Macrostomum lignano TaxID=282301 RepID=A0A1I8JL75_9PLAT
QQNIGAALKAFVDGYLSGSNKALMLGASFSQQSQVIAELARYYCVTQIGLNPSPDLSDRTRYPYYFRMATTLGISVAPVVAMTREFGWKTIGLIVQDYAAFLSAALALHNVTVTKAGYTTDPTVALSSLLKKDLRIFVAIRAMLVEDSKKRLDCVIKQLGAYGPKYQWIQIGLPATTRLDLPNSGCQDSDRLVAMEGSMETDNDIDDPTAEHEIGITGQTREELFEDFMRLHGKETVDPEQTGTVGFDLRFDAISAVAMAINSTLAVENYASDPIDLNCSDFKDQVFNSVRSLDFNGLSGPVKFNSKGERAAKVLFYQIRALKRDLVATYDPLTGDTRWIKSPWFAGGSAPVDSPRILSKLVHASLVSAVVSGGLSACGACLSLAAMAVNLWFRKVPYIRLSSPIVNTIIGLGCLLCHASCLIMTFNAYMGSQLGLCWSQLLCLITGYSCAFGGILAKTWRVHRIFTNKMRLTTIKDWHLCMVIAAILLMDAGLLLALGLLDSPALAVKRLSEQDMISDGAVVLHKLVVCQSSSEVLWKGLIIGMKAVFLLFGIFFAWETRTIHVEALNDSKVIGICVYNTTVMGLIGVVLEFALPIGSVDLRLVLLTCCINICSATTVLLVFGGKVGGQGVLTILKDRSVRVADASAVMQSRQPTTGYEHRSGE